MALLPWACRKSDGQRSGHRVIGSIAKREERGRVVGDAAVLPRVA